MPRQEAAHGCGRVWVGESAALWDHLVSALGAEPARTILSPGVAILLFVFSNIAQWIAAQRERRRATKRLVIGLFAEISHNLSYSGRYLSNSDISNAIKHRIGEDDEQARRTGGKPYYRPLIGITDSTKFYDANSTGIVEIDPQCIAPISLYYRSVSDQYRAMQAIESYAFLCVTLENRIETIDDLWRSFEESASRGKDALAAIRGAYPPRWFSSLKL